MEKYRKWGLWLRIALPFLLFVVLGSVVLCACLYAAARKESRDLFATLARTNADFIRSAHLPITERTATDLGRILDLDVCFHSSDGQFIPALPQMSGPIAITSLMGVVRLDASHEAIATPVDPTHDLLLLRTVHDADLLLRPFTLIVLASFWVLSLVLAGTITRGVVRPLRVLALRLPQIENDDAPFLPGIDRNDEIGLLARVYRNTHLQLLAERERREKAERLAVLGKIAAGLAHEINNPVSAIRMHAQLVETAGALPPAVRDAIPIILGETSKIESLVNQWMFLARPAPPQVSPTDLGSLVADVARSLDLQARHARTVIEQKIPAGLIASVDARRIRQAVGNIILNAIQAMPDGGSLRISGASGASIQIIFEDAGRGFSEKALLHYADLFYSEKEGGMGIGLSVTTEILKAHGGSLEIANLPQGGAKVTLTFPLPSA